MNQIYRIKIVAIQTLVLMICMVALELLIPIKSQAATSYNQSVKSGIENFPAAYQSTLNNLKSIHPNWNFEAYYTGISWNDLINQETSVHTRNTVHNSSDSSWKCSCGKVVSGYACASKSIIEYYIDPRNFLNEIDIFQFLEISYNANVHTLEGIKSTVKGTFLENNVTFTRNGKTETMPYAQIILDAAKQSNMSPYSITTKIIQEVGSKGSNSVTGTYPGHEGYYNFFNYGAYDTGNAIVNALIYAKDKGWDNPYTSIVEGAKLLANSYTNAGQNTAYFYKWDVVGTSILKAGNSQTVSSQNLFAHQYMTNIQDPASQAKRLYNTYAQNALLDKPLNFVIPIYDAEGETNKLPSAIDPNNPNAYYVNDSDGVNVRSEPSTSASKIASIAKDTIVLVKERKCKQADGYSWDKVELSSGVVGYIASEFLSPCNNQTANGGSANEEKVIGTYLVTDDLRLRNAPSTSGVKLATIPKGEQIDVLQKDVANDGTNIWYKVGYKGTIGYVSSMYLTEVKTNNNNANTGKKYELETSQIQIAPDTSIDEIKKTYPNATGEIKTGAKITIDGKSYTVVVKGDTSGDGTINSADLLKIVKHLKGISTMSDKCYQEAADTNKDGTINSSDLLKIVKYLKGTSSITL